MALNSLPPTARAPGGLTGATLNMPWNKGGPGPWGNPPGSSGGDGDKKPPNRPVQGPWGNANEGGEDRAGPDRGPSDGGTGRDQRPGGGPFGGGGGGGPDLDKLIAQAQVFIRGLLGG